MVRPLAMRDVLIEAITERMREEYLYFLSGDFGSPKLDRLRAEYPENFINVGIAEQNLINVSAGLALEGFTVFAYAIAPFITMRCLEQIRTNLAMLSQFRQVNVNLVGVGTGFSYNMSGPTHQTFEDISIMRSIANIEVISPADGVSVAALLNYAIGRKTPKYLRLDSHSLPPIYQPAEFDAMLGFGELRRGEMVCLIATGYMSHQALTVADRLIASGIKIGVIDLFMLSSFDKEALGRCLRRYSCIVTLEEGFIRRGGLDSLIQAMCKEYGISGRLEHIGVEGDYPFAQGKRDALHAQYRIGIDDISQKVMSYIQQSMN